MTDESPTETELDPDQPHERLPGCVVYVASGDPRDVGRHATLRKGNLIIGKSANSSMRLHDARLSRQHLELAITAEGIVARDLGSTNGTRIDGQRVERALLRPGARLRVGQTILALLPLSHADGLPASEASSYDALLGQSLAMRRLFALLERVENSEAPALVQGETGSGKELVARALHAHSARRTGPFVVLDCASIAPELASDAIFGHARGAFTSADEARPGVFEQAHGGTLFIDELGELPLAQQTQLLRAIETGEVRRLGEDEVRRVDVRIVAATHRDLARQVASAQFREDLYFRIAVLVIDVPPLRERIEDVPRLAAHFATLFGGKSALPASVVERMCSHTWPGNVRELRNAVQRVLTLGHLDTRSEVSSSVVVAPTNLPFRESRDAILDQFERVYLEALMTEHEGNLSAAARAAGLERHRLRDLLRKHDLHRG